MYIPRSDSPEDAELLDLYRQSGDPEYLGKLYGRYMHLVYGVCLKYLGDREQCKDAVLRIYEKLGAELLRHEVLHFRGWLHVLVRNHCLMELRAAKARTGACANTLPNSVYLWNLPIRCILPGKSSSTVTWRP
jgi:DNA-directed RNA polymerase specialized sigma24 family protein